VTDDHGAAADTIPASEEPCPILKRSLDRESPCASTPAILGHLRHLLLEQFLFIKLFSLSRMTLVPYFELETRNTTVHDSRIIGLNLCHQNDF
jgi:hypothetical protein